MPASFWGSGFRAFRGMRYRGVLVCAFIFLVALGVRAVLSSSLGISQPPSEPLLVAQSLARWNAFANPYKELTGPTAHCAPAFPFLVSLVYRAFGTDAAGSIIRDFLAWVAVSLQYALLLPMAMALGLPWRAGVCAGLAGAFLPLRGLTELQGYWEAPYAGLLLVILALLTIGSWRRGLSWHAAVWTGTLWGIAFLFSPTLLPILGALLAAGLFVAAPVERAGYLRRAAAMAAAAFAVMLPWMVRNRIELGTLAVRDNFGLELWTSYHPGAAVRISDNFLPEPYGIHPSVSTRECERIRHIGEVAYNREKLAAGLGWIERNPAEAARLAALRFGVFWFQWTGRPARDALVWAITLAGILGLARLWCRERTAAVLFLAIWLSYPPVYYLIEASTRYRYPIDWTFLLLASYLVTDLAAAHWPRHRAERREAVQPVARR